VCSMLLTLRAVSADLFGIFHDLMITLSGRFEERPGRLLFITLRKIENKSLVRWRIAQIDFCACVLRAIRDIRFFSHVTTGD